MAPMTVTASFLSGASIVSQSPATACRRFVIVNSSRGAERETVRLNVKVKTQCNNGRRDLIYAAAAAAFCSVAGIAVAEEPKPGSPEAKKLYAPICVTMPTAKICHK